MKTLSTLLLLFACTAVIAQNGYIRFHKHSIAKGYVRVVEAERIHEETLELKQSENDPHPKHYHKKDVMEYAILADTFRILKEFYPYEVTHVYFDLVEAQIVHSGKVSLLKIDNGHALAAKNAGQAHSEFHDEGATKIPHMYVLHDSENDYFRGVPSKKEKFEAVIPDFFSEEALALYERKHGKIHYRDLEKLVEFCNAAGLN